MDARTWVLYQGLTAAQAEMETMDLLPPPPRPPVPDSNEEFGAYLGRVKEWLDSLG